MSAKGNNANCENWREKVRKLLTERKINNSSVSHETSPKEDRYSLDLDFEFQQILEAKNIPGKFYNNNSNTNTSKMENSNDDLGDVTKVVNLTAYHPSQDDENDKNGEEQNVDTSFEIIEKMCNKSASDPDSTLFKYLNSDNKQEVMADIKKRSLGDGDMQEDAESAALQRLLDELAADEDEGDSAIEEQYIRMKNDSMKMHSEADALRMLLHKLNEDEAKILKNNFQKSFDITQLEDIEAPSHLWESTLTCADLTTKTSPVKMVGLLRPSTIMEENNEEESNTTNGSSKTSFQSVAKDFAGEISSSCYETANEYSVASTKIDRECSLGDDIVVKANKHKETINLDRPASPVIDMMNFTVSKQDQQGVLEDKENLNETLISSEGEDEESEIISLTSDDEETNGAECEIRKIETNIKSEKISFANLVNNDIKAANVEHVHERRASIASYEGKIGDDKENFAPSIQDIESASNEDEQHFNDTLEQVEFMMKKGMEMAAAATLNKTPATKSSIEFKPNLKTPKPLLPLQAPKDLKIQTTPLKLLESKEHARHRLLDSPRLNKGKLLSGKIGIDGKNSPNLKTTPRTAERPKFNNQNFAINIKPMPKLDLFKKPLSNVPACSNLRNNKNFPYVVSPIGAYVKSTATTPLMTTFKNKNKVANTLNSTALRELEYESRLTKKFENPQEAKKLSLSKLAPQRLPKKAYISSECQKIIDDRSPFTIPGGKKIQKYLENAMLPTVVRHEGKIKYDADQNAPKSDGAPHIPKRTDHSLADLSVMSGDVSLYTLMDAKKF